MLRKLQRRSRSMRCAWWAGYRWQTDRRISGPSGRASAGACSWKPSAKANERLKLASRDPGGRADGLHNIAEGAIAQGWSICMSMGAFGLMFPQWGNINYARIGQPLGGQLYFDMAAAHLICNFALGMCPRVSGVRHQALGGHHLDLQCVFSKKERPGAQRHRTLRCGRSFALPDRWF